VISKVDPGPFLNDLVTSRLSGPGFGPRVRVQDVRRENLFSFAGDGCAVVTTGIARAHDGLVLRPVHDAFGATHLEQAIHWRRDNQSAALPGNTGAPLRPSASHPLIFPKIPKDDAREGARQAFSLTGVPGVPG
jgi:hypothetical protein